MQLPWAVRQLIALANGSGRLLGAVGRDPASLSVQKMMLNAVAGLGLSDFWGENFRTPFELLTQSLREEVGLNFVGRLAAERRLSESLRNRLLIASLLDGHIDVSDLPVRDPLFIVGLPRTGTTLLHHLLSQDSGSRRLLAWEAQQPAGRTPKGMTHPNEQIARTRRHLKVRHALAPRLKRLHQIDPEGPQECIPLLFNTFMLPIPFSCSYQEWYLRQSVRELEAAYIEHRTQLQIIQLRRPQVGHWVLKSPLHLYGVEAILRVFPKARIIFTHRDPTKAVGSLCSFFDYVMGAAFHDPRTRAAFPVELLKWAKIGLERADQARSTGGSERTHDVYYAELIGDPVAVMQGLYDRLGYEYTPEFDSGIKQWLRQHSQNRHGQHRYSLEDFGLSDDMIDDAFGWYREKFSLSSEKG
jgi:hypothetical protein